MQRRQCLPPVPGKQRKVEVIGVEVDNVELVSALRQTMQRNEMIGQRVPALGIEEQRPEASVTLAAVRRRPPL